MAQTAPKLDWIPQPPRECDYVAGFMDHVGQQLYYVRHPAHGPTRARILLIGPFANERTCSAMVWRRWACRLADAGFEVLRFDYRGVGESTGDFRSVGLADWLDDTRAALALLGRTPPLPTYACGLRLGALLGSHLLDAGEIDGLLAWDPPANARDFLLNALRTRLTIDMSADPSARRVTREEYIAMIERGEFVDVEGFRWGDRLWQSAAAFELKVPEPERGKLAVIHLDARQPARFAAPGRSEAIPLPSPQFWKMAPILDPDLKGLFERSLAMLDAWVGPAGGQGS